jgi:hypothetical protein
VGPSLRLGCYELALKVVAALIRSPKSLCPMGLFTFACLVANLDGTNQWVLRFRMRDWSPWNAKRARHFCMAWRSVLRLESSLKCDASEQLHFLHLAPARKKQTVVRPAIETRGPRDHGAVYPNLYILLSHLFADIRMPRLL